QACLQVGTRFSFPNDQRATDRVFSGGEFFCVAAGNNHTSGWHPASEFLRSISAYIDYLCTLCEYHIRSEHSFFFHTYAFHYNTTTSNKTTVFHHHRACLQWFQHTANTNTTAQMNAFPDLCAAANGGPGVDHRSFIHISTNIHIRWH